MIQRAKCVYERGTYNQRKRKREGKRGCRERGRKERSREIENELGP